MIDRPFSMPLRNIGDAQAMIAAVLDILAVAQVPHRAPPPVPTTCCGRGCNGCVWEGYFTALVYWRDQARERLVQANAARPVMEGANDVEC